MRARRGKAIICVVIYTSKLKMFLNIRNNRESKQTSGVIGESIVPNSLHCYGVVMPTACLTTISCVTVSLVYLFMTAL